MARGVAYHRMLARRERADVTAWHEVEGLLRSGGQPPEIEFRADFARAALRWTALPPRRRELLAILARMELELSQVRRIADEDERQKHGIVATTEDLLQNPYLLCEQDRGSADSEPIGLDIVDRALRPD